MKLADDSYAYTMSAVAIWVKVLEMCVRAPDDKWEPGRAAKFLNQFTGSDPELDEAIDEVQGWFNWELVEAWMERQGVENRP